MFDIDAARDRWHPVAASDDLPYRHVFHAQILGRELALWRADDNHVNAWENRCLHRGVRLSIGINDGTELVCQYHGWRYANRTAGCTYIPAHPADAPARTICNNTYPCCEHLGLVWSCESSEQPLPAFEKVDTRTATPLRAVAINCSLTYLTQSLSSHINSNLTGYSCEPHDDFTLIACSEQSDTPDVIFFLQPQTESCTIVRGIFCGVDQSNTGNATLLVYLKRFSHWMNRYRDNVEAEAMRYNDAKTSPWVPIIPMVSEANASLPELNSSERNAALRVRVARIDILANGIRTFRLESIDTALSAAQPGSHIDVHLPNGLIRQYSLINGPGQTDHYAIAVKQLTDSTGGSLALHTSIKVGDVLACSIPRNNFSMRRDAELTVLIAGGIGITPLLSMARALHHSRLPFELHYFVAAMQDIIFKQELESMSGAIHFHTTLSIEQTSQTLEEILQTAIDNNHIYICGPGPMISTAQAIAVNNHWPDKSIHFEYFKNTQSVDASSSFTVELAKSGLTLTVAAGESLLSVLRNNNVAVASSCEQGACGTCKVTVIDGEPDHQDVYLSDSEKREGACMMSCVSRAKSDNLILDL
jgi:ferredoxin-NADP reductase/nitrite reductase/ring-hydroxylating ferredoxin subunit